LDTLINNIQTRHTLLKRTSMTPHRL